MDDGLAADRQCEIMGGDDACVVRLLIHISALVTCSLHRCRSHLYLLD